MDRSRSPWYAVVRLAVVVSAIAAAVAAALSAFGDVPQTALVIAVIVVAFVVSWIRSGHSLDDADLADDTDGPAEPRSGAQHRSSPGAGGHHSHRVAVVPAPARQLRGR